MIPQPVIRLLISVFAVIGLCIGTLQAQDPAKTPLALAKAAVQKAQTAQDKAKAVAAKKKKDAKAVAAEAKRQEALAKKAAAASRAASKADDKRVSSTQAAILKRRAENVAATHNVVKSLYRREAKAKRDLRKQSAAIASARKKLATAQRSTDKAKKTHASSAKLLATRQKARQDAASELTASTKLVKKAVALQAEVATTEGLVAKQQKSFQSAKQVMVERSSQVKKFTAEAAAATAAVAKIDETYAESEVKSLREASVQRIATASKAEKAAAEATTKRNSIATILAASQKQLATQLTAAKAADVGKATKRQKAAEASAAKAKTAFSAAEKQLAKHAVAAKSVAKKLAAAKSVIDKAVAAERASRVIVKSVKTALPAAFDAAAKARSEADGGLVPLTTSEWDKGKARHLLSRAGFGGTQKEIDELYAMGLHGAVEHLVQFARRDDKGPSIDIAPSERGPSYERRMNSKDRSAFAAERRSAERGQQVKLREWWLERMVCSEKPLQENLALFWHGHFAVNYRTIYNSHAMNQQHQLFRGHTSDSFGTLLRSTVHDAAMLRYLDNNSNYKGHPNENLAREIMELFAMGEGQGYTEKDIQEAARALTGYTYDPYTAHFRFVASRHDGGKKTIFGKTGNYAGDDLVDLILRQPATSRFIAGKLFRYFAHENPSKATVDRLASVLRTYYFDVKPMLRSLFLSKEFYGKASVGTQIKSPAQLMVGTLRRLGVEDVDYARMDRAMQAMGQTLFEPPNVKGWEGGRTWVNANRVLTRYNSASELVLYTRLKNAKARKRAWEGIDVIKVLDGLDLKSSADVVDHLLAITLTAPLPAKKRKLLIDSLGTIPPSSKWDAQRDAVNKQLRAVLITIVSSPEFQLT